jgi:hypothetical protein
MRPVILSTTVVVLLSACSAEAPTPNADIPTPASASSEAQATVSESPAPAATRSAAPAAPEMLPSSADAPFADKVWRVERGGDVEVGTAYTFLHDGTLVIDAPHGTPSTGRWRYDLGKLTMVEEGVAYPTDVISQDATHLVLRSHNPGGSVDITLALDANAPLPHP